jgi:hypothetical protein
LWRRKHHFLFRELNLKVTYYAIPLPGGSRCGTMSSINCNNAVIKAVLVAVAVAVVVVAVAVVVAVEEALIIAKIGEE